MRLLLLLIFCIVSITYAADTTATPKSVIKPDTSHSTEVHPKAPTNWSKIKDLFL